MSERTLATVESELRDAVAEPTPDEARVATLTAERDALANIAPGSVQPFNTLPTLPDADYDLETEVMAAMDADPNYPLGETDAMKWAIAWRITRDRNGIDANSADTDGWMVGWFANAMTSADPKSIMQRSAE